jgi:hypothetical protein
MATEAAAGVTRTHLYIRERRVPQEYLVVLAGVFLLSFVLVGANFRGARAFLETKSITEFVPACYLLVAACLLAAYFWPVGRWASGTGPLAYAVAGTYLGVPIFLAGMIFAFTFRRARLGSLALASNLLGTVLGGTAEFLSLAYGIRSLSLLALAMYGCSFLFWLRRKEAGGKGPETRAVAGEVR